MNYKNLFKKYSKLKHYGFSDEAIIALYPEFITLLENPSLKVQYYFLTAKNSEQYYSYLKNPEDSVKFLADIINPGIEHFTEEELSEDIKLQLNMFGHHYKTKDCNVKLTLTEQISKVLNNEIIDPNLISYNDILTLYLLLHPEMFSWLKSCTEEQAAIAINLSYENIDYISEDFYYLQELVNRDKDAFYYSSKLSKYGTPENYLKNFNFDTSKNNKSDWYRYKINAHFHEIFLDVENPDDLMYALVFVYKSDWLKNHEPQTTFGKILKICINADNREDAIKNICKLYDEDYSINSNLTDYNRNVFLNNFIDNNINNGDIIRTLIALNSAEKEDIYKIYKTSRNGIVKLKCIQLYPALIESEKLSRLEYILVCNDNIRTLNDLSNIPDEILISFISEDPDLIMNIKKDLTLTEIEVYLSNIEEIPQLHRTKINESLKALDEEDRENLYSMFSVLEELDVAS